MSYTKENNGGEQQPYIPAGNGKESGQFTFKESNYCIEENCTNAELKDLLTSVEYEIIRKYTNIETGKKLNEAIRKNTLSKFGELMRDSIISSINKHSLKQDVVVYRGINVSYDVFYHSFYSNYIQRKSITGSLICSTSRCKERAIRASKTNNKYGVGLVFEIFLPKGYKALPIEAVALDPREQEILISRPMYKITQIKNVKIKNHCFKQIVVKLERN